MPRADAGFIDTSGWIAILNAEDQLHTAASQWMRRFELDERRLVTTDWVLAEAGNGMARTRARTRFPMAVDAFMNSASTLLLRVDETAFLEALVWYRRAFDKTWGMIDCASFALMKRESIAECLTADRHFRQAGFRCLLLD